MEECDHQKSASDQPRYQSFAPSEFLLGSILLHAGGQIRLGPAAAYLRKTSLALFWLLSRAKLHTHLHQSQFGTKIHPMRIIALSTLRTFWEKHPLAMAPLQGWYQEVSSAEWKTPAEIKAQYRNASFVGNNRVVFNIKGNDYRIVVAVVYKAGVMFIKFVGTHEEYDQADVETVEHKA